MKFENVNGCHMSSSGSGPSRIDIAACHTREKLNSILHEIGHSLGLFHEQSRSNRDEELAVTFNGDPNGIAEYQYKKMPSNEVGGPIDYNSIMMYPFTTHGAVVMQPINLTQWSQQPTENGNNVLTRNSDGAVAGRANGGYDMFDLT